MSIDLRPVAKEVLADLNGDCPREWVNLGSVRLLVNDYLAEHPDDDSEPVKGVTMTIQELATRTVAQWDNHDRYRDYDAAVEPTAVSIARAYLANLADLENAKQGKVHPSHEWNNTILDQCVRCGEYRGRPLAWFPCDPSKTKGKMEPCCECGEDYPLSDLIAGHIYCSTCREKEKKNGR
jgi:hypothetical protein